MFPALRGIGDAWGIFSVPLKAQEGCLPLTLLAEFQAGLEIRQERRSRLIRQSQDLIDANGLLAANYPNAAQFPA